jgi:hypothetical protein
MRIASGQWFRLGFFGLVFMTGALPARADESHSVITMDHILNDITVHPTQVVTPRGSIAVTAAVDETRGDVTVQGTKLFSAPTFFVPNNLDARVAVPSPTDPMRFAMSHGNIDLTSSFQTGPRITLVSRQTVEYRVNPGSGGRLLSATAETRDPFDIGIHGFGGVPVAPGTSFRATINMSGPRAITEGGRYTSVQYVVPKEVPDPANPPADAELVYSLSIDTTAGQTNVTFTAGTTSMNFLIPPLPPDIDPVMRVKDFLQGMPFVPFDMTVTTLMPFDDVTFFNIDTIQDPLANPEPSSLLLGIIGVVAVAVLLRKKQRPHEKASSDTPLEGCGSFSTPFRQ